MNGRIYLDWNATAPLRPEAKAAMERALLLTGNPSSIHGEGRAARRVTEEAREGVAALVGAEPRMVSFTSGGTEANMTALSPNLERDGTRVHAGGLLVSAVEHVSVRAGGRFPADRVETIPVDDHGIVDLAWLEHRLAMTPGEPVMVSVMLANNETGIIQPVADIAELTHAAGSYLHVDAVQGPGKVACNIKELGVDFMTISAHKLGGPAGMGALVRRQEGLLPEPLIRGGGQERSQRAGTENLVGIAGFGAAAAAARENLAVESAAMMALRDRLELGLKAVTPSVTIFGERAQRLPNTTLFALGGKAETLVIGFDLEGVAVSSGSACSSGKVAASHVLEAMGVAPELARGAIRVSLGRLTTQDDVDCCISAWKKLSRGLSQHAEGLAA